MTQPVNRDGEGDPCYWCGHASSFDGVCCRAACGYVASWRRRKDEKKESSR